MKQFLFFLSLILLVTAGQAQMNIGSNQAPQSSAMLQISGNTKGFLPPRMSRDSMYLIANPATGLIVYNTTDSLIFMRRDTGWIALTAGDQLWQTNGNAIYNGNSGFVGIGTNNPTTLLHVEGANPLTLLGVADGTNTSTDSILTITNGLVRKLPLSSFALTSDGISSATAPLTYSGGIISIDQASTTTDGYLSASDYNIFNNKVSSISINLNTLYAASSFALNQGAATGTLVLNNQISNKVFAGPTTGANAQPTFRSLVAADLPKATTTATTGLGAISVGSGLSVTIGGVLSVTNPSNGGSVTSVSVASANGLAGTVATATTTPAITLSTTVTGMVKGNGTALSAATSGTDYAPGTAANSTGIVKSTTGTGALTTATASDFPTLNQNTTGNAATVTTNANLTGDVTSVGNTSTIATGVVTNAKLATMATQTFKGRTTAGTGSPEDLTATQATAMLNTFTSTLKGLVPASGGGTANFLRADGTFAVPSGTNAGTVTSVSVTSANGVSGTVATSNTTPAISLTLGDITPSSVAATGTVTGSNLSGTNTGDETNTTIKTKLGPATATNDGYLTATDWTTFNNKASTTNVISSLNGLTATSQTFATPGTTGTAPAWSSAGSIHTLNIPLASATGVTAGLLSNADWTMFNNKASTTNTWSTTGNAGTSYATNFLGTTDNISLRFRTNNTQRMIIDSLGNVAMGTDVFDATNPEKFLINAGNTSSVNGLVAKGTINNYFQMNIKNLSSGNNATSDIVATADNGTETTNYVDLGINGSGYTGSAIQTGIANDGYLISAGNDFYMVNSSANKSMLFLTGGTGVANERMRILANGRVGMGVQDPTAPFVVKDTMEIRRVGSLSQLLFTNTAGTGDFRIGGDGGDLFWQGGGSRGLQMGSYWSTILTGDRQTSAYPAFVSNPANTGVLVLGQRDASVPLGVQANSGSQLANLTEWRNSSGTVLSAVTKDGNFGIGISNPSTKLHIVGTNPLTLIGVQTGTNTTSDSLLTITNGLVRKLPVATFASPTNSWSTTGNAGTSSVTNFLGTTDNNAVSFKTNNIWRMRLDSAGGMFIGDSTSSYTNTVNNTQAGLRSDWTTSLTSGDVPRIALQGQMRANLTTTSSSAQIRGFNGSALVGVNNGVTSNADIYGGYFLARRQSATGITEGTGTLNILAGAGIEYGHTSSASSGGTTNNVYGIKLIPFYASGTITNMYGLYAGAPTSGGTVTNMYDIYLASQSLTGVTNSWGIYQANTKNNYFAGNVGIGTTTPATALQVVGTNPLTLNGVQTGTNTSADSLLTITNGLVRKLPLSTFGSSTSNAWSTIGNTGTMSGTNFLGTADNASLKFRTNNTQTMLLDSLGNAAIGSAPSQTSGNIEKLLVDAGTTSSFNVISGKGSINNYLQLNIQNRNAGGNASSDVVATADNGDESNNFVDLGINSSVNSSNYFGAANDAYLYAQSQNMLIGTASASKSVVFLTGGGTQSTNERMRINGSGNVGIGTNNPLTALHVSAASNPLTLNGVQTGTNTDSILTISGSVVKKLSPSALAIPSSNAWSLTGNTNTLASNYFLGTTNSDPLIFKVNSQIAGRLDASNTFLGSLAGNNNGTTTTQNTGIGYQSLASNTSGTYNTAIGYNSLPSNVSGSNNIGVGYNASVANNSSNSIAIGTSSISNNSNSIAVGTSAQTNNTSGLAIGNYTYVNGLNGVAIGNGSSSTKTQAYGNYSVALGYNAYAGNTNSIAIGTGINSNASNSIAIGSSSSATVANSTALGASASAAGANSTAIGYNAAVASDNTIILGDKSNTSLSVGIGSESFSNGNREKLLVDAGNTSSFNVISGKGNINNYLQLNIQNSNAGTAASSDVVATADNGNETTNYIDMGINSSANTANYFGGTNDAYLYTLGQNMLIGTAAASKSVVFLTGGSTQSTNERMRIDGSGNVGIGTTSPSTKLHIVGTNPLTLIGVQTGTNTSADSLLTITSGLVRKLPLSSLSLSTAWSLTGNAGTTSGSNFLGTTDNASLKFRTNNTQTMLLDSLGNVAIGSSPSFSASPNAEKLLVDAGTTNSFNVISGKGNINNYLQLNIQNKNAGSNASSDVVATADNGDESNNFVDLGINSSVNNTSYFGAANDAYLYAQSQNMLIGTASANKSIVFLTGGGTQSTNERMRIDGSGNVGIGTNAPTSNLTVYQSSGTGSSKGITLTGNSIGGTSSGTGFLLSLGYNQASNKQLWLGDADYAGNNAGTFIRFEGGGTSLPTLDAISGNNTTRRYVAIGIGGDGNSGVTLGNDGSTTNPSSYVWDNGNMAIGNGYRSNAAPSNGLLVQGNVGIGTTSPTAVLHLKAGTATANTAPLKLTSGTNLGTPEDGAVEYDGTNYFATQGTTRYTLAKTLTNTASLSFNSTAANTSSNATSTITVSGAATGDVVDLGIPAANGAAAGSYSAYVSAANTVTIKFSNNTTGAVTPATGTFRVTVIRY